MKIVNFKQLIKRTLSNKLRAFLTMLGIFIAIFSLSSIQILGASLTQSVMHELSGLPESSVLFSISDLDINQQEQVLGFVKESADILNVDTLNRSDNVGNSLTIILNTIDTTLLSSIENQLMSHFPQSTIDIKPVNEFIGLIDKFLGLSRAILGAIAGISFLVGTIGIMNAMFASVAEQRQSIGLLRALGASREYILLTFLYESALLSISAGALALILSTSTVYAILYIIPIDIDLYLQISTFILSLALSLISGLLAGLLPAIHASLQNPGSVLKS